MGAKPRIQLKLHKEITQCTLCAPHLPLGPRPVVQFSKSSRVVIVGQAPGTKVHDSGFPWDDDSGDHLREWLDVDRKVFYDPHHFAHVPMGFCYPGRRNAGDAPPRPECAPQWHDKIFAVLPADAMEPCPVARAGPRAARPCDVARPQIVQRHRGLSGRPTCARDGATRDSS